MIDLGRGRTLTVDRAGEPRLRRLVIAGHGWWSFEVPRWLAGIGASWLHLDLTGRILGDGPGDISPDLPGCVDNRHSRPEPRWGGRSAWTCSP